MEPSEDIRTLPPTRMVKLEGSKNQVYYVDDGYTSKLSAEAYDFWLTLANELNNPTKPQPKMNRKQRRELERQKKRK